MNFLRAASQSGFTLIELVAVMVLLGVLAVMAIPSYKGSNDFAAYSAQDQIITGARMAQQWAMYDRAAGNCYRLNVTANAIRVQRNKSNIGPTEEWRDGIPSAVALGGDTLIYFDGVGNAIDDCPNVGVQNAAEKNITIAGGLAVCVNPVGYVYAC